MFDDVESGQEILNVRRFADLAVSKVVKSTVQWLPITSVGADHRPISENLCRYSRDLVSMRLNSFVDTVSVREE